MRYWKRTNPDGTTNTVESYSHNLDVEGAIEITKQEFDDFIASIPVPEPEPDSPDRIILKNYLADPHSGLPDLKTAFQALAGLYLGL